MLEDANEAKRLEKFARGTELGMLETGSGNKHPHAYSGFYSLVILCRFGFHDPVEPTLREESF